MSNPNLNTDGESLSAVEKEFENNIRPSEMADFSGQLGIIFAGLRRKHFPCVAARWGVTGVA